MSEAMIEMRYQMRKFTERVQMKIAWSLPHWLVRWATIHCVAHATTGKYGDTVVPELTAMEAVGRWDDD